MPETEGRSARRWIIRCVVVLALVGLYFGLQATVLAPEPVAVLVLAVAPGIVQETVTNSKAGTVRARRRSRVTAETGGRVVEIRKREGDRVEAGEVVVRLNDASMQAQHDLSRHGLSVSKARREEACLGRDRAQRELTRKRELANRAIVSEDVLDALQYAYDSARVSCDAAVADEARAVAQIAATRAELDKTLIRAPFDGIVAELSSEIGEWVTPSPPLLTSPAVLDLIDTASNYVSAPMDEVDSSRTRAGQAVEITVDSRPGEHFAGRVVRVAPYVLDVETQNRTVEIEVEFEDVELAAGLLPGTSADVEVILEERREVARIPTEAILGDSHVLVLEGGKLVKRQVALGLRNWEWAELRSGVEPGELVVRSLDRLEVKPGASAVALDVAADAAE